MMTYFADTWFWIALISKRDNDHVRAKRIQTAVRNSLIVTSEMVLAELLNFFAQYNYFWRSQCCKYVNHLIANEFVQVIPQSSEIFSSALSLYCSRPDQGWSLTDCSSIVIMNNRSITYALTNDQHFAQAGLILFELK
jgi:predicted nucleic acid-binding protein